MQPFLPDSPMFMRDQLVTFSVETWDTPFTALVNDIASGGVQVTIREPQHSDGVFSMLADMEAASSGTAVSAFNNATASTVVTNGRLANLVGYWAAGAPGYHGAAFAGRIAYHFEGWVRPPSGRDWFDPNGTFTATVACAGNGYFRVDKNASAELIDATMTEKHYLQTGGGPFFSAATSFTTDDKLDLYYVQDGTTWGGFVFKLIPGTVAGMTEKERLAAYRDAPVIGCGLVDDRGATSPVDCDKRTLQFVQEPIRVSVNVNQTQRAEFRVPLANTQVWDGVGWEWVRGVDELAAGTATGGSTTTLVTSGLTTNALIGRQLDITAGPNAGLSRTIASNTTTTIRVMNAFPTAITSASEFQVLSMSDAAGILRLHAFEDDGAGGVDPITFDVKRQRLVRIKMGFLRPDLQEEVWEVFTGFTDDFEGASTGTVTVQSLGIEQRLVDQHVKNYPDKISYMTYGYRKLKGTSEPVYGITAYDNWPLEFAIRDMLVRGGIDESRTRAPLRIPLEDGSWGAVVM